MNTYLPVSVIIVNWRSEAYLLQCLDMLLLQTIRDFEVLIINNGSSVDEISDYETQNKYLPLNIKVESLGANLGFATANNIGARLARGKWIALLNADAYPEPEWLENLVKVAEENSQYTAFSSRQIQYNAPHLLDGAGDVYHVSGPAWRMAYNQPTDRSGLEELEIFSPCAAAALYSRKEFLQLGGFDENYFSYFEDVDLGFRLRLNGGKSLYVPGAVVYHVGSASTGKRSDFSVYHGYRNMIWTFFKNMPSPYFWLFLPLHISAILFFAVYFTLRGQGRVIWKAIFDAIRGLPNMLGKRKAIQEKIKVNPRDLLRVMSIGLLEPYHEFLRRNRVK